MSEIVISRSQLSDIQNEIVAQVVGKLKSSQHGAVRESVEELVDLVARLVYEVSLTLSAAASFPLHMTARCVDESLAGFADGWKLSAEICRGKY